MSFPITIYPTLGAWWKAPNKPSLGAPDVTNIPMQMYCSPHGPIVEDYTSFPATPYQLTIIIKTPAFVHNWSRFDTVRPDNTIATYYQILFKEFAYLGFPQCFEMLLVIQCNLNATTPRTY